MECWVRFTSLDSAGLGGSPAGHQYIVFKQNTLSSNFEGFDLEKTRTASGDVFRLIVSSSAGASASIQSTTLISTGVWYHVAALRGSDFLQLYVNGQLERQTNVAFAQNYGNLPLYFGSTGQSFWDHKFNGNLDEVSLYNRPLSSNEIAGVYLAGVAGKCKTVNITTQPQNQSINIGSNATFTVGATGFGNLAYQWQFNSTNIVGTSSPTLVVASVQVTNAGNYRVVVTNSLSSVTSAVAVLTVNAPPFITVAPTNQTALSGANVSFNVSAGGTAPLNYQWRKSGVTIPGQTNPGLSLTSVTTNDSGNYDVVVANVAGSVTSAPPAVLTVNAPPFITVAPTNQTALSGANVSFNVSAGGTAPLNYQWRKSGVTIPGQTNPGLSLTSVTTNDSGNYDVVVANVAGSVTSAPPAVLTVNAPPFITVAPTNQTALSGANVSFNVSAGGTAPLNYQWRKSGVTIPGQTNPGLSLTSVTTNDSGNYDVVVANVAGSVTSAPPAVLTVNAPPFITVAPTNQTALSGANVSFNVSAGGTAPLNYQWRKSGVTIPGQTNPGLSLTSVTTNDSGNYDVVVANVAGSVTSAPPAVLTVNAPPFITVAPTNQTALSGANVSFNVSAGGTAPLNYQWRKSGVTIPGQTNPGLSLTSVTTNDSGNYDVVVANVAGSVTSAPPAVLTILLPTNASPFVITPPTSVSALLGANVNFSVNAGGTQPLSYQWRKNNSPLNGETTSTLQLIAITTNNAGNYDVIITNNVGATTSAPPATLAVVPTLDVPPFITLSPASQIAGLGSDLTLTVTAGGTAPLNYQWRKNATPMPGQNSPSLNLPNLTTNDTALYDCTVANTAGNTTSAVASVVVRLIVDPQLEAALRCALGKPTGDLAPADIATLTNLFIRNRGITNLYSLQHATNLADLDASQNTLDDLAPLQGLTQLRTLELDQNEGHIDTIAPLAGLTNLTCLVLGHTYPSDYTPLTNHTSLLRLVLRQNNIRRLATGGGGQVTTNLSAGTLRLAPLTALRYLDLSENTITNITALAGLTNLDHLDLRWNLLTNQDSQWTGPTNLTTLHLGGNHFQHAPALQGLPRLTHLNLEGNHIRTLAPLAGLTNLTYLSLSRNPNTNYTALATLTNLTSLELSAMGSGISGLGTPNLTLETLNFLSPLTRLRYLDASYNTITNLNPLVNLTNIQSLVLAGVAIQNEQLKLQSANSNAPFFNFEFLISQWPLPHVRQLWLHQNALTNATFLTTMPWLTHLNLDDNHLADLTPALAITNLTGLSLSRNPLTNLATTFNLLPATFSRLTSLRLDGNTITDTTFLQNLTQLTHLSLNQNRITELYTIDTLANLRNLYLKQNRISDLQPLSSFGQLAEADVTLNLIPVTSQQPILQDLQCQTSQTPHCACVKGLWTPDPAATTLIHHLPQRQPPRITAPDYKFIPANGSATLAFNVADDLAPLDPLPVSANSLDTALISNNNLLLGGTNIVRALTITPQPNQAGNTTLLLTVTNEAGLTSNATIHVTILIPIGVTSNMLPPGITNLDPQFQAALRQAAGKPNGELTSVDLLNITTLDAVDANLSNFTGWQWLTNLTTLTLSGSAVTNLDFLTNLTQLTTLSLRDTAVTHFEPIARLTHLTALTLHSAQATQDNGQWTMDTITFLTPLTQLTTLTINGTLLGDITPLAALTNLIQLDLQHNRLANIQALVNLPQLAALDLRNNLMDTTGDTVTTAVLLHLNTRAIAVNYLPQRKPPVIRIGNNWNIAANRSSWLYFQILEDGQQPVGTISFNASPANPGLLPANGLVVGRDSNAEDWFISATPATNQNGTTTITLAATNDVGFTTSTTLVVTVVSPLALDHALLGTPNLIWQTDANAPWFGHVSNPDGGLEIAQSGNIGNFGTSTLQTTILGPGTLSFWWKVSSETNFDWLIFETGSITNQISGETDWQQQTIQLRPELQTLQWRYQKDQNQVQGMDASWLALVSYEPRPWLKPPTIPGNGTGPLQMQLYGQPGQLYEIQTSTNLIHWSVLTNMTSTNNIMPFADTAPQTDRRFYRARALP